MSIYLKSKIKKNIKDVIEGIPNRDLRKEIRLEDCRICFFPGYRIETDMYLVNIILKPLQSFGLQYVRQIQLTTAYIRERKENKDLLQMEKNLIDKTTQHFYSMLIRDRIFRSYIERYGRTV